MPRRFGFAALVALLALAACGRSDGSDTPPAQQQAGPSLASCGAGQSAFSRTLCDNQQLAALDTRVREALTAEAASVSDAGAQMLAQGQQRWLETQRVACGVIDPDAALDQEQTRCLDAALRQRVQDAGKSVQQVGGYTFQTVEIGSAQAVTAEAAAAVGLTAEDAPNAIVRDIRFPRIDGAATAEAQRFNQLVAQQPQFRLEDQTDEQIDYTIAYAGPSIISVRFNTYDNTLGAAHPNNGAKAVTVVMTEGRALAAADVFRAGSGWENYITRRALQSLTQQFREDDFAPPQADVRESATKPHLWLITERGLTILFPPYSFGGPHVLGGAEVEIPWSDLRPYLNPNAPAPIGARA